MMPGLSPELLKDKLFKIRKLQLNTYEIDHPTVKGQLRLTSIPLNILEIPDELIPPQAKTSSLPNYAITSQTIIAFTNRGRKSTPSIRQLSLEEIKQAEKVEITSYIIDSPYEPWNEFVIQGEPPILLKERTILSKLEWLTQYANNLGDPFLWGTSSNTNSVSIATTGEAGLA